MDIKQFTLEGLEEWMAGIKKRGGGNIVTNYFKQRMTGSVILGICTDRSVMFVNDDADFLHLYFYSSDLDDLEALLKAARFPAPVVIDYITKEPDEQVKEAFRDAGFSAYATFVRLSNYNLRTNEKSNRVQHAETEDLEELWRLLMKFDKYTDHLMEKEKLLRLIREQQVIVNKKDGAIKGYIMFQTMGAKVNFNHFYNRSDDPRDTMILLESFYNVLQERGIKSGILWVNVENIRVLKLHKQFGWREDGLKDLFYIKHQETTGNSVE